ncbi:cytochrome b N-terminal domain-containing protein [Chloroflexota bacterium]
MQTPKRPTFFHHLHPPTIPARQSRLRYTLGAGGLSVYLILVITITGLLEMFYYIPTPEEAGASIQLITYLVPYGALIRNLHYWAAQLLVIVVVVHMLRVIMTGAYTPPRRFNYLLGLGLLISTLFLNFSGYVLRWDEGIRWALVAGTNLIKSIPWLGPSLYRFVMGGSQPNPGTLSRFYTWHIFGLTLVVIIIGGWHVFKVRRDGGIAAPPPKDRRDPSRITRFELVRREGLATIIATIFLLLLASFIPAPIAPAMTEVSASLADSRAPWFFLWVQQLLRFGDAFWMGVAIPLGIILFLAILPYLFPRIRQEELGEWLPRSARIPQILTVIVVLTIIGLTLWAIIAS